MKLSRSLIIGDEVPSFELENQHGELIQFNSKSEHFRILYFYPKNNTPKCDDETCSFRDVFHDLEKSGVELFGISSDSVYSHAQYSKRFRVKHNLLSDVKSVVRKQFGATQLFNLLPLRTSFLINPKGEIIAKYEAFFQTQEHVDYLLRKIKELNLG